MTQDPNSKRAKLADAKWSDLKAEMRQVMVELAQQERTITYAELCAMLKTAYLHYHSPVLVRLLDEIGLAESQAGRPVLPAVVVTKQTGIPGAGYFRINPQESPAAMADARALWEADLQRVFEYWSKHES